MPSSILSAFVARCPFSLDEYQRTACSALDAGKNVLVCAPTGAGKTVVGEYAVELARGTGRRCVYTTPIKALSNQKYHDLVVRYGEESVGLLTGDVSINASADVVVMTTEVLRNMMYAQSPALADVGFVVLDEIHYLANRSRGVVWEEVILGLDEAITIVGLSATVSNAEEFGAWIRSVRGRTEVVVTEARPVPLRHRMLVRGNLYPLFAAQSVAEVNPSLERAIENHRRNTVADGIRIPLPRYLDVIRTLANSDLLPAIYFIFSRSGCDKAVARCRHSRLVLTNSVEARQIGDIFDFHIRDIPSEDLVTLNAGALRAALSHGFAPHHAGMLPAFRHAVEEAFQQGLVKVVFATETLALGINMPARSVVLERLTKFNGEEHADLTAAEYTQLTGRAGRRGIDREGSAVVLWTPEIDPEYAVSLAGTRTYPIHSTFQPGYNMTVNLLATMGYDQALRLLEMSFAQFEANSKVVERSHERDRLAEHSTKLEKELYRELTAVHPEHIPEEHVCDRDESITSLHTKNMAELQRHILAYAELRRRISREEKRARREALKNREEETRRLFSRVQRGEVIALPSTRSPMLAVILAAAESAEDPRPRVVTEQGWVGRLDWRNYRNTPVQVGRVRIPHSGHRHPTRESRRAQQALLSSHLRRPRKLRTHARVRPTEALQRMREELRAHPIHRWPHDPREKLVRTAEDLLASKEQHRFVAQEIDQIADTLGKQFDRLVLYLKELGYVAVGATGAPENTGKGEILRRIHCESDLLVAECLRRRIWADLDPAELAGVVCACVFERRIDPGRASLRAVAESMPTQRLSRAVSATLRVWQEIHEDEQRHALPGSQQPDYGLSLAMHQWTAGAPLDYALEAANACGIILSPGDFVRWCGRTVDLLEQLAACAPEDLHSPEGNESKPSFRKTAQQAINAIERGVVTAVL